MPRAQKVMFKAATVVLEEKASWVSLYYLNTSYAYVMGVVDSENAGRRRHEPRVHQCSSCAQIRTLTVSKSVETFRPSTAADKV